MIEGKKERKERGNMLSFKNQNVEFMQEYVVDIRKEEMDRGVGTVGNSIDV